VHTRNELTKGFFAEAYRDNTTRTTLAKMRENGVTNDELVLPDQVPTTTKKQGELPPKNGNNLNM
jgi:hypothetical protein